MGHLLTEEYEQRDIRLLERIESKRQLLKMYREATQPSLLMIDESAAMLAQYVDELDGLMQEHGLSVQLTA